MTQPRRWPLSRRTVLGVGAAGLAGTSRARHPRGSKAQSATPVATPAADAAALAATVEAALSRYHLRAALARVVIDGAEVVTVAAGESMTGVPAAPAMRFRSGSIAIAWMATALLRLVEDGAVTLDMPVAAFLPELPNSDLATLEMLANMTAGYPDYVSVPAFSAQFYADPFQHFEPAQLIAFGLSRPLTFAPGTNWAYSHTNYVILGLALEQIAGQPLATTLRELVLDPLGLHETLSDDTAALPEPVLHAYTSERRSTLQIPAGVPFLEESTYWDPSWTLARGAVESSTITDLAASAIGFGEGLALTPAMHERQVSKRLVGFGTPVAGCATCRHLDERLSYGLGVALVRDWIVQNPSFGGYGGTAAYLPPRKLAIATAVTYTAGGFDAAGNLINTNASTLLATELAALLAPDYPLG